MQRLTLALVAFMAIMQGAHIYVSTQSAKEEALKAQFRASIEQQAIGQVLSNQRRLLQQCRTGLPV